MQTPARIMIVEDEMLTALGLKARVEKLGHEVSHIVASGDKALQAAAVNPPDLVLMDIGLKGDMDGIETARRMRSLHGVPIVFLTAYMNVETINRAKQTAPYGYLVKPVQDKELVSTIEVSLHKHSLDEQLRESKERYQAVMSHAVEGILLVRVETGEILEHNRALGCLLGYTTGELLWRKLSVLYPDGEKTAEQSIRKAMEQSGGSLGEQRLRRKDGTLVDVEVSTSAISSGGRYEVCFVVHDLTEQKRMEEERRSMETDLCYRQKMEGLGRMAGAVAHSFNNILSVILGNAELLAEDMPQGSYLEGNVLEIIKSCNKAERITRQMLTFLGHIEMTPTPVDLSRLISEMHPLLEASLPEGIVLTQKLVPSLPEVACDASQIRQALLNLFLNASEAIIDPKSGVITLSSGMMYADKDYLTEPHLAGGLPEGRYVTIDVADNGCGIDEEDISKVFDPFFTTKFYGRGLGMTAILGIVRRHRGYIKIFSTPGKGTRVQMGFPGRMKEERMKDEG